MKRPKLTLLSIRLLVAILAITLTGATLAEKQRFSIIKNLDIFNAIVKELQVFYVDTINADKLVRTGIDRMLYSLDPYTEYFPKEDQDELEQMIKGSFGGIGSFISYDTLQKRSMISEPFEGSPAAKSGLKAGDILMKLNGEDLQGKTNADISRMLRGKPGTAFKLEIKRPMPGDKWQTMEKELVRESIHTPAVPYHALLSQNVGYICLASFSGTPAKEFKQALEDLKAQGATSLIVDLRGNGGGLLDEAVKIANIFLPAGKTIVYTKGQSKVVEKSYKTSLKPTDPDMPLVFLVNSTSASASEVLSGAMQDLDRAVIIGTRTFGKGLVQSPRELPYGGTIKITTSKYYIPSGRCVQAIDYSHRNPDGSVGSIPDSLIKTFHTVGGRPVKDGGGITPDVTCESEKLPGILFYLIADNRIFHFATQYVLKHPTIAAPEKFRLTEADYEAFKQSVLKSNFKYDRQSEKALKALKETAEFEGYLKDADKEFAALEAKLKHNPTQDLDQFKKVISQAIEEEILKRYYFQKGVLARRTINDTQLKKAVELIKNPEAYQKILSGKTENPQPKQNS